MNNEVYKQLYDQMNLGNKSVLVTNLSTPSTPSKSIPKKFLISTEALLNQKFDDHLPKQVYEKAAQTLETGILEFIQIAEEYFLIEPYFPEPQLIIFGAGHIAMPLAEFGSRAGFTVTVIDDRPSFANHQRFPTAQKVICESFEKCFDLINIHPLTFIVIVTRGHRHDMDCLRQVLNYQTAYTGMIGSKRRVKGVMEKMREEGFSQEQLDSVNSPIGFSIGAVTPDEIAFSIIAEVISYRRFSNFKKENSINKKQHWPEYDPDVINELATDDDSPKAIITIVKTKGSVPRKEGAKMIVWPYGKLLGSIGGGCSEGTVITTARDVIATGGYQFQRVDMTGIVAEDEGMACGGIMDVIIEYFE
ncbi:XdhC family protein [Acetobacterium woodii]|uniref:Xanthine and CO dehydrogenases maturation factor XdhC/CoxF n=1 Tax=Acetobacterium woodii (strain ATCC 29683 / DSM 1030 / JCM 2381 / KCTC 1655 / WB1) TaxID=931626 RepID=H6LCU4_ACEWD|nr:XdhC/CoxI family protein [Acetobacterium woodii]AFA49081.1 xanthine and CO dehydrogenases maturation factor XdhC/CoxF [Acetobacterium woodii DSM 1030]